MESREQLKKIALYCDKYNAEIHEGLKMESSSDERKESCTNCSHFTDEQKCELDLIDKVLSSLSMENQLKS